jgi:hypothetical protein
MHCEDLLIDDGCNWQAIETVRERLPKFDVVTPLALIIKAVDAIDGRTFVVATQHEEVLRVFDLVGKEKADGLERLFTTIYIVSKKEIVRLRWESTILEETQEIIVLAVDITTYLYGGFELQENWLRYEDLSSLGAQEAYFRLE